MMNTLCKNDIPSSQNATKNAPLSKTTTYQFDGRKFVVTPIFRQEGHETLGGVLLKLMQTENA